MYKKTFVVFASSLSEVLKKAIAQLNVHQENFCNSSKLVKTAIKLFSCVTFGIYSILNALGIVPAYST